MVYASAYGTIIEFSLKEITPTVWEQFFSSTISRIIAAVVAPLILILIGVN